MPLQIGQRCLVYDDSQQVLFGVVDTFGPGGMVYIHARFREGDSVAYDTRSFDYRQVFAGDALQAILDAAHTARRKNWKLAVLSPEDEAAIINRFDERALIYTDMINPEENPESGYTVEETDADIRPPDGTG